MNSYLDFQPMRMMKSLEAKLKKEGLITAFNENVADFMRRGVIKWVDDVPGIQNLQKSYIPLTYTGIWEFKLQVWPQYFPQQLYVTGPQISQ